MIQIETLLNNTVVGDTATKAIQYQKEHTAKQITDKEYKDLLNGLINIKYIMWHADELEAINALNTAISLLIKAIPLI